MNHRDGRDAGALRRCRRRMVRLALQQTGGNISRAALWLGISRAQLTWLIQELDIDVFAFKLIRELKKVVGS